VAGGEAVNIVFKPKNDCRVGTTEQRRSINDALQDGLQVEFRAGDNA
jgi:hypothetical protein